MSSTGEERPAGTQMLVVCVIVNWNGWEDTVSCLTALQAQDFPALEVIVVDNGSTNDSVARIRAAHPWAELIETGKNLGFSTGCNVGSRAAYARGADWIWLLNNDTVAPPDTLRKLVLKAKANPGAGAIGSVLYYMHDPSRVQAWGGGTLHLTSGFVSHFTSPASFEGTSTFFTGASLMLPRRVCEEVGIFFEGFFMYCDDSDLCMRIHRAGYPLVMAEDTAILHKEGGSSPKRSPRIDQFATTSMLWLLRRQGRGQPLAQLVYLALRLGNRLLRGRWANAAAVGRGVVVYMQQRPRFFPDRL